MAPTATSLLVFGCIFGAGLAAMRLRTALPEHHLSADTKDTVKLAMGLVATMTALVLGLLVASAKGAYDAEKSGVTTTAAKLVVLDRMLAHYGPETAGTRDLLRRAVEGMLVGLWPDAGSRFAQLDPTAASGDVVYDSIEALSPGNEEQRTLKAQALSSAIDLGQIRWLLFVQAGSSISTPLLLVVAGRLGILFVSFGQFASTNGTAIAALMVSALSVSGAIFLILELDRPFDGLIHISSGPMRIALDHLGK
ncbi:MAG: hypothetical protein PHC88_14065 [Terrimicrobiaceae bacterium]|nr:hypothetical protein [Terrimicrobiaceae bacterium]